MSKQKKRTKSKSPGEGVSEGDFVASQLSDSTAKNISQCSDGVSFDWTCPKCGAVRPWKRPWSPEVGPSLRWFCSWCPKTEDAWIWVPKAGWNRLVTKEERERRGAPRLDHELRWLLECECGAVHRPKDREFILPKGGNWKKPLPDGQEPELRDIEPTRWEVECSCGRKRLLLMREGRWNEESLEFNPPAPKPPVEPLSPPEDKEPLLPVTIQCGKCGDEITVEARSEIRHICERCGRGIHLAKHRVCHCEKCGDEFKWQLRRDQSAPCCVPCQGRSQVTDLGRIVWEEPPNTDGSTHIAGEFRDQIEAMLRDYEGPELPDPMKASSSEEACETEHRRQAEERQTRLRRANIAEEACEMADVLLRFLVDLAVKHEDHDAVRWLSHFSRLGERRVPSDDWASIEDRLTGEERPRAKREWDDMQEFLKRTQPHVSKSVFATVVRRIASDARWWRFGWFAVEEAKRAEEKSRMNILPRAIFPDGVPGQIRERKVKWLHFLESWGIKRSNAPEKINREDEMQGKWLAIPYPARYDETGSVEALVDEVLVPIFNWWRDTAAPDYAAKKYPKKGALKGRIRQVLGLNVTRQNKTSPSTNEAVQDGRPS